MIFGWKKTGRKLSSPKRDSNRLSQILPRLGENFGLIRFENVSLANSIHQLSLDIPLSSWVALYGEDDFAKALFCDLCFSYIQPESGRVHPVLKGGDVSFLGRSNTTYGDSLVDHLNCGVTENSKELLEIAVDFVLSKRFHRLLAKSKLQFLEGKRSQDLELDERDFLELAEANVILQRKRAVVIDTTSDFYHIALEQGFRHSKTFLQSQKTLIWIVDEKHRFPEDARPWQDKEYKNLNKISLSFPLGSRAGYIN
jgi:hypothetical protein